MIGGYIESLKNLVFQLVPLQSMMKEEKITYVYEKQATQEVAVDAVSTASTLTNILSSILFV